ncbi:MAG: RAMP superfamily CRISPR-associated protein, partial [Candidatus Hodarchaeota archaeon]
GKLVIPGSTLKGALRAELERFLIDSYYSGGKWKSGTESLMPCIPSDKRTISNDEKKLLVGKYRVEIGSCHYPCDDRRCGKGGAKHSICPACYLLGSMSLNGFIKVPFLYAEGTAEELYSSRIDRATKTVVRGTNRPYELVPDGVEFTGVMTIVLENSILGWKFGEPRDLGEARTLGDEWIQDNKGRIDEGKQEEFAKTYILDRLKAVNILGGYRSKGFGKVEISIS